MRHVKRSLGAISPVLAVLMMIAIAIAGSLVVYAWVMGYTYLANQNAGQAIEVQSIFNNDGDLLVYVQNVGQGVVQLDGKGCLYINGQLVDCVITNVTVSGHFATLNEGETATLRYVCGAASPGERVHVKVTTTGGKSAEMYDYPAGTAHLPTELDHFEFNTITSPQIADFAFEITIRAVDMYGELLTHYDGFNGLSFSGGEISPIVTGDFVEGVWSGEVTVSGLGNNLTLSTAAASNLSCTGTSNPFGVTLEGALWANTYGGSTLDVAHSLVKTFDGGYALAGYTYSFGAGAEDFWLVKTDEFGNIEWSQAYGGSLIDRAYSVIQTADGGYAITGYADSSQHEFWLVKTDASGNMEWNQTYVEGVDGVGFSVVETDNGYVIAGGELLIKTYTNGTMEWSKTYEQEITSLLVTADKGYLLGGDSFLIKTDEAGTIQWNETYETEVSFHLSSVIATSDGGYALAGGTHLIKTNESGELEWSQTYGVTESGRMIESAIETSDGGYALTGYLYSSEAGNSDFWLIKTNELGEIDWSKTYGGTSTEWAHSLLELPNGHYVLAGYTSSYGAGTADFLLLETE